MRRIDEVVRPACCGVERQRQWQPGTAGRCLRFARSHALDFGFHASLPGHAGRKSGMPKPISSTFTCRIPWPFWPILPAVIVGA